MRLADITSVHSGHITRTRIEATESGSHCLVQARDVDGERLTCRTDRLTRFHPTLSRTDLCLEKGDLLFMAKGAHNFTIKIDALPGPVLAAACFFIVRPTHPDVLPGYLAWYLNQAPVAQYLVQHSGRGVHLPVIRRAVLENIEVPIVPREVQVKIAAINALMVKEMDLLRQLGRKRQEMITAACLQAIGGH